MKILWAAILAATAALFAGSCNRCENCAGPTEVQTPPVSTGKYEPATMQLIRCAGGEGSLCTGGMVLAGPTTLPAGAQKIWAVITHHAQKGCALTGALWISSWGMGAAGQLTDVPEDGPDTKNPVAVAIALNASPGTARLDANFTEICVGQFNQTTPLRRTVEITVR